MKTISTALKTHLQGETTTLAWLWKVTRQDSQVFGFTTHDSDISLSGITYAAATGMLASAAQAKTGASVDNMEMAGMLDSAAITDADVLAGLWDNAAIVVSLCNWSDLTQGAMIVQTGTIGNVSVGGIGYKAEMRSLGQALQQTVGRTMRRQCDANLGDTRCGVTLATYTVTGTVTGTTSRQVFAATTLPSRPNGVLTWTTGANNGLTMEVKADSAGTITLALPMPYDIAIGDTYSVAAGCDKNLSTCRDVFSNVNRFRGFAHIPGIDSIRMYPNAS